MPDAGRLKPLAPGSTIGILGSGQLGRMLAMAAARLGLKTHIYCEKSGPAFDVSNRTTEAPFDDREALAKFAEGVDCPWQAKTLLSNAHVKYRHLLMTQPMDHLVRNGDGDELIFVHDGDGDLFCDFGRLSTSPASAPL